MTTARDSPKHCYNVKKSATVTGYTKNASCARQSSLPSARSTFSIVLLAASNSPLLRMVKWESARVSSGRASSFRAMFTTQTMTPEPTQSSFSGAKSVHSLTLSASTAQHLVCAVVGAHVIRIFRAMGSTVSIHDSAPTYSRPKSGSSIVCTTDSTRPMSENRSFEGRQHNRERRMPLPIYFFRVSFMKDLAFIFFCQIFKYRLCSFLCSG